MMKDVRILSASVRAALLCTLLIAGCKRGTDDVGQHGSAVTFPIRGRVVSVDTKNNEITLSHDAVAGFMEAMTMPYPVHDPAAVSELHPGDTITARIVTSKDADGEYHNTSLDRIVIVGQAKPDYVPVKHYNIVKAGDPVPDFKLLDQSSKTLHLHQFQGKALLITFIYTRCPLGDFCPKMSRNFAEIDAALKGDQTLYGKTDLLSVSFDPVYDTPAVLRSYGSAYTGRYTQETFDHWQFAAPNKADLPGMEQFFDVGVTGENATLTHSLSTVLIGPDGKIVEWYPGNAWKPADVVERMRAVTRG